MSEPSQSFPELLAAHQHRLLSFIQSLLGEADSSWDVLRETNRVLLEKRGEFQAGTNFAELGTDSRSVSDDGVAERPETASGKAIEASKAFNGRERHANWRHTALYAGWLAAAALLIALFASNGLFNPGRDTGIAQQTIGDAIEPPAAVLTRAIDVG